MAVQSVRVTSVEPFEGGASFGEAGPYEYVQAVVDIAVDPANALNANIVDLAYAERGADGLVHAEADLRILRPAGGGRGNGGLLYSVVNRGNVGLPFNLTRGGDASAPGVPAAGDAFLLKRGWTVAWSGWQFDVIRGGAALGMDAPNALIDGEQIEGEVRLELHPASVQRSMRLLDGTAAQSGRTEPVYPPVPGTEEHAQLRVRETLHGPGTLIEPSRWQFAHDVDGKPEQDYRYVWLEGGFQPGRVYDLIYRTRTSPVVGMGLAAVRDVVSHLKYGQPGQPRLIPEITRAIGTGSSQTGRFLRQYISDAMNFDEQRRPVFDGLFVYVAGGRRGEFNHRYAQPAEGLATNFGDAPPYAWQDSEGGLADRQRAVGGVPKMMSLTSAWEYWRGDASLAHTDVHATRDIGDSEETRYYLMASVDHVGGAPDTAKRMRLANPGAGVDPGPLARPLFLALDRWITDGTPPPASRVPRIADGTGVRPEVVLGAARALPGLHVPDPEGFPTMRHLDQGPQAAEGVAQWPAGYGDVYPSIVSAVDADGNEVGGIRLPEVQVPVATLTGWNTLTEHGQYRLVAALCGSRLPFALTRAEREANGDPRPSIEERYASRDDYLAKVEAAAQQLIADGFLLPEDAEPAIASALRGYDALFAARG